MKKHLTRIVLLRLAFVSIVSLITSATCLRVLAIHGVYGILLTRCVSLHWGKL